MKPLYIPEMNNLLINMDNALYVCIEKYVNNFTTDSNTTYYLVVKGGYASGGKALKEEIPIHIIDAVKKRIDCHYMWGSQ